MHDDDVLRGAKAITKLTWPEAPWEKLGDELQGLYLTYSRAVIESQPRIELGVELVERCASADYLAVNPTLSWLDAHEEIKAIYRNGMIAALRIALNDPLVLGDPKDGELTDIGCLYSDREAEGIRMFISNRRNRLLSSAKAKPWSERITLSDQGIRIHVCIDEKPIATFYESPGGAGKTAAAIWRSQLIAQKEREQEQ